MPTVWAWPPFTEDPQPQGSCSRAFRLRSEWGPLRLGNTTCPRPCRGCSLPGQSYHTAFEWLFCLTSPTQTQAPGEHNLAALWIPSCRCEASRGHGQFHGRPPRREHRPPVQCQPWVSGTHRSPEGRLCLELCLGKRRGLSQEEANFPGEALAFRAPTHAALPRASSLRAA